MRGLNELKLIGRLTRDSEVKTTSSGKIVTRFSVAVDRPKGKDQEKATTDFINVDAWGKLGEIVGDLGRKGALVYVEARVQPRSYEDNGVKHYVTDIVAQEFTLLAGGAPRQADPNDAASQFGQDVTPDEEVPF